MSGSPDAAARGAGAGAAGRVRLARPEDAAALADVHVRSWQAAYRGIVPDAILDGLSVERRAAWWRETLTTDKTLRVWVVEGDGRVVGFAATAPRRDDDLPPGAGEVESIYLAPDAWSVGLGRAVLAVAVDDLQDRGFEPLVLWVLTLNERARGFYEAVGWRPDGERRMLDFDGNPIEEMRYTRTIGPSDP
ncbi:MAG: GNAT family N-acetyltransferase [Chloroflexota bacterium]